MITPEQFRALEQRLDVLEACAGAGAVTEARTAELVTAAIQDAAKTLFPEQIEEQARAVARQICIATFAALQPPET